MIKIIPIIIINKEEVSKDVVATQLEALSSDLPQPSLHSNSKPSLGIAGRPLYRPIPQSSPIEIDWKALERVRVKGNGLIKFNNPLKNFSVRIEHLNISTIR